MTTHFIMTTRALIISSFITTHYIHPNHVLNVYISLLQLGAVAARPTNTIFLKTRIHDEFELSRQLKLEPNKRVSRKFCTIAAKHTNHSRCIGINDLNDNTVRRTNEEENSKKYHPPM